jgi:hypothetical protein
MKTSITTVCAGLVLIFCAPAFAGDPMQVEPQNMQVRPQGPRIDKKMLTVSDAFRVKEVRFERILMNNQQHLVAAVIFNKNIDAATVQQNLNIRLLKQDANGFWVDASTQNNNVNVRPNFITWVSGAPIEDGAYYKMHLRGTIKSTDGKYLDCDGDGQGEGGALPPYESQTYRAPGMIRDLEEIRTEGREHIGR